MPTSLEERRRASSLEIPTALRDILHLGFIQERIPIIDEEIRALLPHLGNDRVCTCTKRAFSGRRKALRVGVFFSGGPAPGGHNVIAGLFDALRKWNRNGTVIGFLDGPDGLLGDSARELAQEEIDAIRNTGGFSLLGTGRAKIESEEEISLVADAVCRRQLDGLVCIGGDDSNTDAALIAEAFCKKEVPTCVVGVPKTIDGDLRSPDISVPFGFDTACKVYSGTIGDIAKDCLSVKKQYFFIRLMGRFASHITLECAMRTQPNLALIGEEIAARAMTLSDVVSDIAGLVEERHRLGRSFGVVLIPEGIIEQMADVREHLVVERDPHGNVRVSQIDSAQMLALAVQKELSKKGVPFAFQTAFCGYEGRSAFPSDFDCTYGYALGRLSAVMVANKLTGYMAAIRGLHNDPSEWSPAAVPLASLLDLERRSGVRKPVIRKTLVDLSGPAFRRFAEERDRWRRDDHYLQPGPIQFD